MADDGDVISNASTAGSYFRELYDYSMSSKCIIGLIVVALVALLRTSPARAEEEISEIERWIDDGMPEE